MIPYLKYDVHAVLNYLKIVNYNTDSIDQEFLESILLEIDWDNFVLDRTALELLLTDLGIDYTTFRPARYQEMLDALNIVELKYDVHTTLEMIGDLNVDTSTLNQTLMYELLSEADWDSIILDKTLIIDFLSQLGVDVDTVDTVLFDDLLATLGIVNMPFDVNMVLDILTNMGIDVSGIDQNYMYEILINVDWDTYIVTKTSVLDLLSELNVDISLIDMDQLNAVLEYLEIENLPVDIHLMTRFLQSLNFDTSTLDEQALHEELVAIDWANTVVNKMWFDEFLLQFNIVADEFDREMYYDLLLDFDVQVMAFNSEDVLTFLKDVGISTRGISTARINELLYEVDWDDLELTIDFTDEFLANLGVDVRYIDQITYHHLLSEIGVVTPTLNTGLVQQIMTTVGIDASSIAESAIDEQVALIDQTTMIIDEEGVIGFFVALGVDVSTVPVQAIIEQLDYAGFHVINPNAELEALGLDPETIRAHFEDMGIDDDVLLDYLTDPTLAYDSSIAFEMLEETFNPKDIIAYLDELRLAFGDLGNDDISVKLNKVETDVRNQAMKRQKQTKQPKQIKFGYDSSTDLSNSVAGFCNAESTAFGGQFFIGVGARSGWDDVIVGWGQGLCAEDSTAAYGIDLMVGDTKVETGQYLTCDYSFIDKSLYLRDDTSSPLNPTLFSKSTAKTQFIGLKDDVFNALLTLGDPELEADTIVLDTVLRSQDFIKDDITAVLQERQTDIVGDVELFKDNIIAEMESIRTDFIPTITAIEEQTIVDLNAAYTEFESALDVVSLSDDYTGILPEIKQRFEEIRDELIANLDQLVIDLGGTFAGLDGAILNVETAAETTIDNLVIHFEMPTEQMDLDMVELNLKEVGALYRQTQKSVDVEVNLGLKEIVTEAKNTINESRILLAKTIKADIKYAQKLCKSSLNSAYKQFVKKIKARTFDMGAEQKAVFIETLNNFRTDFFFTFFE